MLRAALEDSPRHQYNKTFWGNRNTRKTPAVVPRKRHVNERKYFAQQILDGCFPVIVVLFAVPVHDR